MTTQSFSKPIEDPSHTFDDQWQDWLDNAYCWLCGTQDLVSIVDRIGGADFYGGVPIHGSRSTGRALTSSICELFLRDTPMTAWAGEEIMMGTQPLMLPDASLTRKINLAPWCKRNTGFSGGLALLETLGASCVIINWLILLAIHCVHW